MKPYYKNEFVTLYLGDCLRILPGLKTDLAMVAITSPPYNLNKKYSVGKTKIAKEMNKKYETFYPDELPEQEYQNNQRSMIRELRRICKSSLFYNHRIRYAWNSRNINPPPSKIYHPMMWLSDFPIWCEIIWSRRGGRTNHNRYTVSEERIYQIGRPLYWRHLGLTNVWRISQRDRDEHPCPFPEQLVYNCLYPSTEEGDTIIDPYIGIGTTALCAVKTKRRCIGIEREEKYLIECINRIEQELKQLKLF